MVITHSARGHIDDFLAVCLASYATGSTTIKRVKHSDVDEATKSMSDDDIMVDIGGVLDPKRRIFDHHHDRDLPSAFVHTAKYFNFKLPKDSLWQYLSNVDTKGPEKARKIHNMSLKETGTIHEAVQPIIRTWDLVLPEGTIDTDMFITIGDYLNKREFDLSILRLAIIKDVVQKAYPKEFAEATKQLTKEKSQKQRAIEALTYTEVGGYTIAIHKSDSYLSHTDTYTSVILTINQRTGKPCLIVDTEVLHVNEILELLGNPDTVFVHANGFLAVIDDTWENTVNKLLNKEG